MSKPKPWYRSRVIWANILLGLLTLLAAPEVRAALGPDALSTAGVIAAAINIALRFITTEPIAKK